MPGRRSRALPPCSAALASLALLAGAIPARGQSNAFTYQGQLDDAGQPTSGLHDFRFLLWNDATSGVVVGTPQCFDDVDVVDGVFTVQLDFGVNFATTLDLHLEVDVRPDTGLDCTNLTGFVAMTPRQPITAAPRATHAKSAYALDAADGVPSNAVFVDADGKVGIGTTTPNDALEVNGTIRWSRVGGYAWSGEDGNGFFLEQAGTSALSSRIRLQASRSSDFLNYAQFFIDPDVGFYFIDSGSAQSNVGIGTTAPLARLDVRGDIRLGSGGQYQALAGEEKLRIIRGRISSAGAVLQGSGFTASRSSAGTYLIGFSPQFPTGQAPAVTVSAEWVAGTAYVAMTNGVLSSGTGVRITNGSGTLADQSFYFIAVGPR